MKKEICSDLCIIGNGLVGNSLLASLKSQKNLNDLKVVMIGREKKPFDIKGFNFKETSNRIFTINISSKNFLDRIGVWDQISKLNSYQIVNTIKVLDSYGGYIKFRDNKIPLAFTADDLMLDHLLNTLNSNTDYEFFSESLDQIKQDSNFVFIKLSNGEVIKTRLLAACDGANSLTAKLIDRRPYSYDYQMMALSMTVEVDFDENNVAIQKFTPEGIFAFLPLGDKKYSLIWSGDAENIKNYQSLNDENLTKRINIILEEKINEINFKCNAKNIFYRTIPGKIAGEYSENYDLSVKTIFANSRCSFPLTLMFQPKFSVGRVIFLGDSAHRVLPISGHGFNLGLGDAELFSNLISLHWDSKEKTLHKILSKYNRERKIKAASIAAMTSILNTIYSSKDKKLGPLSAFGLQFLDMAEPIKKILIQSARY